MDKYRELLVEVEAHRNILLGCVARIREEKSQLAASSNRFAVLDYLEFSYVKLVNHISEGLTSLRSSESSVGPR